MAAPAPNAHHPHPAIQLKDYAVSEKLGAGSYGNVYKAHKKTGARDVVAVKCVLKSRLSKSETNDLITEISLLKRLKHEHIVQLVDFAWDSSYIYIIMEYCGGGDLSRFVRARKQLPEDACRRFLQQLAAALQFLRSKDIAHMDLKPQNVLLSSVHRPVLKLADFGLAQFLAQDQTKSNIRGSPLYMAPEMLLDRRYDAKVDLWSVGVILFECLFGKAPYKSGSVDELLVKIKEDKPILIPDRSPRLSPDCRDLLERCLRRDPAQRIDFDAFFGHPFLDLEHMPGQDSHVKALSLAEEAVRKDRAGELADALSLYKSALEYFVPLAHHEPNPSKKESLRKVACKYIERAEELKQVLNPQESTATVTTMRRTSAPPNQIQKRTSFETLELGELQKLCCLTPKMATGVEIAMAGENYELEGQYNVAMDKYQRALGLLLPLLASEPKGRRKTLLAAEVERWLRRAECVKELMAVQEKVLADSMSLAVSDSVDKCKVQ